MGQEIQLSCKLGLLQEIKPVIMSLHSGCCNRAAAMQQRINGCCQAAIMLSSAAISRQLASVCMFYVLLCVLCTQVTQPMIQDV